MNLTPSSTTFRFGDGKYESLGKLAIRIPTPNKSYIPLLIDVVSADVPHLLGLDRLDEEQIVPNNVTNQLEKDDGSWTMPITRKRGHLFMTWGSSTVLFTKYELQKLHRHLYHPSSNKLFNLIKRARPDQAD